MRVEFLLNSLRFVTHGRVAKEREDESHFDFDR